MKYLDNLIAWADQLFRGDTIESINEATQLYVLAAEILGQRPRKIGTDRPAKPQSFNQLNGQLDAFSNWMVDDVPLVAFSILQWKLAQAFRRALRPAPDAWNGKERSQVNALALC
jgi:hypothetical protein